jgi:hypothetical protein
VQAGEEGEEVVEGGRRKTAVERQKRSDKRKKRGKKRDN